MKETILTDINLPSIVYNYVKDKPKKVIDHISPSMLGGCMRTHYFAIKHVEPTTPPTPGALVNFEMGFLYEQVINDALKHADINFKYQWELYDEELNMKGTLDFALIYGDEVEVIDGKTESIMASAYRKREHKDYLEANERYVLQVGAYMLMLRRKGYKCERARLLSMIKDNGMIHEYFVPYTKELEEKLLRRINTLNKHLQDNTLPPCECEGWMVGYCNYGNPNTMEKNRTGKLICTECCPDSIETLEEWRKENATK